MDIRQRFLHAAAVAEQYASFEDFALDGMAFLGFDLTDMQADIGEYMALGPRLRMVMAQRGEAKSTLVALYAVWRLVQRASTRVLVVSGGEAQASEVATLIIRLVMQWEILEYLRPDKLAGDRASIESFDVHHALKGLDKSPSVACVGITANLQGKRADLLIADDIETKKNGLTVVQRQLLLTLSKDFSSICTHGDIVYLGTPQTKDSIYNTLPQRGFAIRIWPGRFPTQEELEKYGDRLAPFLSERIKIDPTLQTGGGIDGSRGKPADPRRYTEQDLQDKELDQGPEDFQLQYMLDTTLADAMRQQLKLADLLVANFNHERLPEFLVHQEAEKYRVPLSKDFPIPLTKMYYPVPVDCQFIKPKDGPMMYIDPAGGGSDEIGYGCTVPLGPYIHLLDAGGIKGGLTDENGEKLVSVIREFGIKTIQVESNMGHGLFEINLRAILAKEREGFPKDEFKDVGVIGVYSTGQKERRIIDSLVGVLKRHRLIVHAKVFESDRMYAQQHSAEKRVQYSLFYQMANITTDRNSLPHDDRVEAVAGAVRYWKGQLAVDENKEALARAAADAEKFRANPMGYSGYQNQRMRGVAHNIQARRRK